MNKFILNKFVGKRNIEVGEYSGIDNRFFKIGRAGNNKRLMIHSFIGESESNSESGGRKIFSDFNSVHRISDRAKIVSFVEKNILPVENIFSLSSGNEIATEFIIFLPLFNIGKITFTPNVINMLDGRNFSAVRFFIRCTSEMTHRHEEFPLPT